MEYCVSKKDPVPWVSNMKTGTNNKTEYAITIGRVSSDKQGLMGDSLDDQEKQIQQAIERVSNINSCKIVINKSFEFIKSASGEFDMQPLQEALEYCKNPKNKIKYAFIKSIDRYTRGGATIYGLLKAQFSRYGVTVVDTYGIISSETVNTLGHLGIEYGWSKFSPSFITELLEAERSKSEVRDILTRMIGAEIRYVRLGYTVRSAPEGYQNAKVETPHGKRVIQQPHPIESPWFIRMFELRIQGTLSDKEIVDEVNALGYKSRRKNKRNPQDKSKIIGFTGEKPLTVKQLQRFIQKPIYAGVNCESWLEGQPIKTKFPGLVTIEMFNKANRGKVTIVEDGDTVRIFEGKIPDWQLNKQKDNPDFEYKKYVLCPTCMNPLYGSASRGKGGNYFPAYHCGRKISGVGHYFRVKKADLDEVVEKLVKAIEIDEKFMPRIKEIALEEWHKREKHISDDTVKLNQRLIQIEEEIHMIKEKVKQVSSPTVIKMLEDDIEKLQQERAGLIIKRDNKETEQVDVEVITNYTKYYLEHLEELILSSTNPIQNAAFFGLLFKELPTYDNLKFGTPKLERLFKLNEEYKASKGQAVSRPGLEPGTNTLRGYCSTIELAAHF